MPCTSAYLEPSAQERDRQNAARLYAYVIEKTAKYPKESPTYRQAVAAAKEPYQPTDYYIQILCGCLREMDVKVREALLYGDPKDRTARQLATWWEDHEAADKKRGKAVPVVHELSVRLRVRGYTLLELEQMKSSIKGFILSIGGVEEVRFE